MSMRAADERAAAELLWSSQMRGTNSGVAGPGVSVGGGGSLNGLLSGELTAAPSQADRYGSSNQARFGMSANAPSFTPGVTSGMEFTAAGAGGRGSISLEEQSLREAADDLWGFTTSGGGASAPASSTPTPARFSVPSADRGPSMSAIEAESMRAAAAGLWGKTSSAPPAPSPPASGADTASLGVAHLPSALLGGLDGMNGCCSSHNAALSVADALGGSCDILAGLNLDGGSEPSYH